MDDHSGPSDSRFSILCNTLNALERSRANERKLGSYKCPCSICKGGGRPVFRSTIEAHLRRHGRDPNLTHSMLPEDGDLEEVNNEEDRESTPPEHGSDGIPEANTFDEGFDFQRLASEWFERVDERRQTCLGDEDIDVHTEESNFEDEPAAENPDIEDWLHESQVPLYSGSRLSALACVLVLMNLAHLHNVSNAFMNELLSFLRVDVLPPSNRLPHTRHEARKLIDRLGLSFSTIHVCRNGCTLFWKDRAQLSECPQCKQSRYIPGSTSIPIKVLRHFPLIPRLLRMYRCRDIASLMKWHEENKSTDGKMRSALDSPAWKEVKNIDRAFFEDGRHIKLGLALDGMNPFADKSCRHSTWPVFLLNYNLPGWMVTKRFFVMLSLLIPGKESVKSANIDVYLEPLVDELLLLWNGVEAVDMSSAPQRSKFKLRAMLLWTIHDYPAYGLISGCATKGYQGCPICGPEVDSRFSRSLRKIIFQGHRRYLPENHPFRFMTDAFNGKEEHRQKPSRVTGLEHRRRGEARQRWLNAGGSAGTENDPVKKFGVKRHSVLFNLPYWDKLLVRHVLDPMHIEKNVAENLLMTLLGRKDGLAVRHDMKEASCKKSLHIRRAKPPETGFSIPWAPYVLSAENRKKLIDMLRQLKMPTGYMSNLKSRVDDDGTVHGLKSHDYHVLIQQILPVCLRGLLPSRIFKSILCLSNVFQKICMKTVLPSEMEKLGEEVAEALSLLERDFAPAFFDSMTHLPVHVVEELQLCGPVHNRWMYPIERYMKYMKSYVRNKARPEGCMASGTAMEVGLGLSTEYILECQSTRKRVWDAEEESGENGEALCSGYQMRTLSAEELLWAHCCVLNNSECLQDLRETHKRLSSNIMDARASFRRGVHPRQRRRLNYPAEMNVLPHFPEWLSSVVQAGREPFSNDVVDLSMPPNVRVKSFKSMRAYGNNFRVWDSEQKLLTADSGVSSTCETLQRSGISDSNLVSGAVTYYGKVMEILELDYGRLKPVLLLCDWVEPIWRGPHPSMKKDPYGFTLLKFSRLMRRSANSFVFPLQASQVYYCSCVEDPQWCVVLHCEPRSIRVFQESPSESIGPVLDREPHVLRGIENHYSSDSDSVEVNESDDSQWLHVTDHELVSAEAAMLSNDVEVEMTTSDDDALSEGGPLEDY